MTVNLYGIRDCHTGFMSPQVDMNDETAKRNFAMSVNNNPGVLGFRPADFDLYYLGQFNTDNGELVPVSPIEFVVNGASVVGDKK